MSTKVDSPDAVPDGLPFAPLTKGEFPHRSPTLSPQTPQPGHAAQSLVSHTPQELAGIAVQSKRALHQFQRAFQAFADYPFSHPMLQELAQEFFTALQSCLQLTPSLELRIKKSGILYQDSLVFEEQQGSFGFVGLFSSAGIRKLVFHRGISARESLDFLAIVHRCITEDSLHDDIVTMMWEFSFPHIQYFLLEQLSTTFLPSFAALSGEYNAVLNDAIPSVKVSQSGAPDSDGELALRTVKQLARSRLELTEHEKSSLEELLIVEERDQMHCFLEITTLILDNHREKPAYEPIINVLTQLQTQVISHGTPEDMLLCFRYNRHLATSLGARGTELSNQWSERLTEASADATSAAAIQRLRDALEATPTDPEIQAIVTQYIEAIEPASPQLLLEATAQLTHPEARLTWHQALAAKYKHKTRALSPGFTSPNEDVVVATCHIFGIIGNEDAWMLLENATRSNVLSIRLAAFEALLQVETSESATLKLLDLFEQYLADPNPQARMLAIDGLLDLGPNAAFLIKTLFTYRSFEQWSPDEIAQLFACVAQLGNYYHDIFEMLSELLLKQYNGRFTSHKKREIARSALLALQHENTPQAAQTVERIYQRAAKPLRRICESIFQH